MLTDGVVVTVPLVDAKADTLACAEALSDTVPVDVPLAHADAEGDLLPLVEADADLLAEAVVDASVEALCEAVTEGDLDNDKDAVAEGVADGDLLPEADFEADAVGVIERVAVNVCVVVGPAEPVELTVAVRVGRAV